MKLLQNLKLWHKVMFGLIGGIVVGLIFGENADYLKPIGDIFIRLIKMIITPLIYISIVMGMTSIDDNAALRKLTIKAVAAFLLTTSFAIMLGLAAAHILEPGKHIVAGTLGEINIETSAKQLFSLTGIINDTIPDNALNALVSGKILQVVFFSFFTGIIVNNLPAQKALIHKGFQFGAKIVFKMISVVLELAPYGAFALTASVVGRQGIGVLSSLGMLVITLLSAISVQYMIFGLLILVFARISPRPFYKKSLEYQALAFSTSSSKATLPTTMEVCSKKMGMSKASSSFVLPLGAAINMDGMAIYLGICTLFFAQAYHIDLSATDYIIIVLTSTLGSIGAAGIPSGTIIMLPMVLAAVNIPIEGIALIVGIDRILDMLRTTINITGDAAIALIVDATEGTLDKKKYYA